MRETIVILQPFGIGDILFVSPIVRRLDYNIIWPVESHYLWIRDYIQQDNITFLDVKEYLNSNSYPTCQKVDFLNAQNILFTMGYNLDCMTAKYVYASSNVEEWKSLYWKRNFEKEQSLMKHLGLDNNVSYVLVNENFADPNLEYRIDIKVDDCDKIVYMDYVNGYTLLDWGMVIENSKHFHTVSTSTFYMVEYLNCTNKELHLYPRYGIDKDLKPIKPIISERWICHE